MEMCSALDAAPRVIVEQKRLNTTSFKSADSAHLLLPTLARVACLSCPLPLVRIHFWPSHYEESIILRTIVEGRRDRIHVGCGSRLEVGFGGSNFGRVRVCVWRTITERGNLDPFRFVLCCFEGVGRGRGRSELVAHKLGCYGCVR